MKDMIKIIKDIKPKKLKKNIETASIKETLTGMKRINLIKRMAKLPIPDVNTDCNCDICIDNLIKMKNIKLAKHAVLLDDYNFEFNFEIFKDLYLENIKEKYSSNEIDNLIKESAEYILISKEKLLKIYSIGIYNYLKLERKFAIFDIDSKYLTKRASEKFVKINLTIDNNNKILIRGFKINGSFDVLKADDLLTCLKRKISDKIINIFEVLES